MNSENYNVYRIKVFELTDVTKKKMLETLRIHGNLYTSYKTYNELQEDLKEFDYETVDVENGYIIKLKRAYNDTNSK